MLAPESKAVFIEQGKAINPYDRIIKAIGWVETRHDTLAYNPFEEAVGYFQVRPIRLIDYNKHTGDSLELGDMYHYRIAEKVFMYYALQIGFRDPERIAREWNGGNRGMKYKQTVKYWERVKEAM